ncbi:AsmA family protein [uncultured Alistipes sp.]|uniref:AsmA family protein n=1 Tax=uncultured Alistipes sp. TaxID=538949 RepID=UPI0025F6D8D7|nr:AsmA family protein [uncultured Alistipes sp.]
MKKFVKTAALAVAVLLLAALVAPTLLRGKIAAIVKREANAALRAELDFDRLDISLLRHFPNASLELKGLRLSGIDAFAGDTILAARRISVVVSPLSLLGDGGFEVRKILLDRPAVHGRKLADGSVNWDIAVPSDQPEAADEAADAPSSFRLSVRDFRIDGAEVRYDDDSSRMHFSVAPLSLRLRGDLSAARSDLELALTAEGLRLVSGGIPLLSGAEAELDAVIGADLEAGRYTFSRNRLRLNAIEVGLDGWVELRDEAVAMDLRAGCDEVQFKEVLSLVPAFYTREFRNLSASGALAMDLWARGELRDGRLPAFGFSTSVTDGSFRYSSLPKAVTDIQIALSVANPGGGMDATVVDLSRFGLKMAGNSLSATFRATSLASDPAFSAAVDGVVDLGAVREVYPLERGVELAGRITADLKASGRMSDIEAQRYEKLGAAGRFVVEGVTLTLPDLPEVHVRRAAATITPQAMTLGECGVTMGGSDLAANGQLTNYLGYLLRGDVLAGRLYVKSELLDLNEILAAAPGQPADGAETSADAADASADAATRAPEVPRNLDLSLHTDLRRILFQKMTISDLQGEMRVAGGTLSLQRLAMGLFGGKASASGGYSTAAGAASPELKLSMNFSDASFQRTFEQLDAVQRLAPLFAKTGGTYGMTIDLRTPLDASMSPVMERFDATGEIRSADIRIQNIEAFDALAKALGNDALRRIEAKDVAIRFAVRNGRIATEPFDLRMGGVSMNLAGSTGLDQTIDYTARVQQPSGAAGGLVEKIGVNIGGTFSSPKITLGVKEAAEEAVKNVVDRQIEKLTGGKSLSEEVERQAERLRAEAAAAGEKLVRAAEEQRQKLVDGAESKGALAKVAARKAGDKLVEEAQKQAEKLRTEAERQIEKLTAEKSE